MRIAPEIVLSAEARAELMRLKQSKSTNARLAQRVRIVLLAAKGVQNKDIAEELGIGRVQVARWRERYATLGMAGIERDLPRGAPPSVVDPERLRELTARPGPEPGKPWTARSLAAALGVSPASVLRHWRPGTGVASGMPARNTPAPYPNRTRASAPAARETTALDEADTLRDNVLALKRERILQVAAKLFFERGYLQTSVDAIAEHLGATKPFVYYHFPNKSAILEEICERSTRAALTSAENAMSAQGSAWTRLEQFLREFTNVVLQEHQMVAIYFREEISLPVEAAERINQMRKAIDQRISALLSEGIATGEFEIEDPRIGALVIAGMSSYAFAWYREQGRLDQQEVANRIVALSLKLVTPSPPRRTAYRIPPVDKG